MADLTMSLGVVRHAPGYRTLPKTPYLQVDVDSATIGSSIHPPEPFGFPGEALEMKDGRGKTIAFRRSTPEEWKLGLSPNVFFCPLPRGAGRVTLRYAHVPAQTFKLRFANPYYQQVGSD